MNSPLDFLFRNRKPRPYALTCCICGKTPTLYMVYKRGFCKNHKEEARKAGIANAVMYDHWRRRPSVI